MITTLFLLPALIIFIAANLIQKSAERVSQYKPEPSAEIYDVTIDIYEHLN